MLSRRRALRHRLQRRDLQLPRAARELHGAGDRFRGHSDTEVLLAAVARVGGGARPATRVRDVRLRALGPRGALLLRSCRDRVGEKPLYYGHRGGALVLRVGAEGAAGSTRRAAPRSTGMPSRSSCGTTTSRRPVSIYRGIAKLLPGTIVSSGRDGGALSESTCRTGRPWTIAVWRAPSDPCRRRRGGSATQLERLLTHGVRRADGGRRAARRLPLGRLDSSTVVALMQAQSARPVRTFTIGFDEAGYSTRPITPRGRRPIWHRAHRALRHARRGAGTSIPKLPTIYDEPFADSVPDPYLPGQPARAPARDGEPFGRRRRRVVRRLQPLPPRPAHVACQRVPPRAGAAAAGAAPAGMPARAGSADRPVRVRGHPRCHSRTTRSTVRGAVCGRTPESRAPRATSRSGLTRRRGPSRARAGRRRSRATGRSRLARALADFARARDATSTAHLSPGRHAGEGRPRGDGGRPGDARPAPRPPRGGVRLAPAAGVQAPRRSRQVAPRRCSIATCRAS